MTKSLKNSFASKFNLCKCLFAARLVGGPSGREGVVQVYNNTWGWICDQQWDVRDADVVCRMIGYTGASTVEDKKAPYNYSDYIWMNNVQCKGSENSLFSCLYDEWGNHSCESGYKAGVACNVAEGEYGYCQYVTIFKAKCNIHDMDCVTKSELDKTFFLRNITKVLPSS